MNQTGTVRVTSGTRLDAHPTIDETATVARQHGASLKIVDVVPQTLWAAHMMVKDPDHIRQLLGRELQNEFGGGWYLYALFSRDTRRSF